MDKEYPVEFGCQSKKETICLVGMKASRVLL